MAGLTSDSAGVRGCIHLWEPGGLGNILLVATRANDCRVRQRGYQRSGILGVLRQRTMAGFAVHMSMLAVALRVGDIGMAGLAGLVTSVVNGPGGQFVERVAAIMPILAEGLGNQRSAYGEEPEDTGEENSGQPEEMA